MTESTQRNVVSHAIGKHLKRGVKYLWALAVYSVVGLAENAMFGWVGEKIADALGIQSPSVADMVQLVWTYGLPAVTTFLLFGGYHWWYSRYGTEKPQTVLTNSRTAIEESNSLVDVSAWTNHGSYFVWTAACLWVGVNPVSKIDSKHPAYPALQKIKGAIDSGQIRSMDGSSSMSAKVLREELLKLAFIHGDRPAFLFQKQDGDTEFNTAFEYAALTRNDAIKRLWKLREEGVAIGNEHVPSEKLYPAWKAKYEKWRGNVLSMAEKVDENLRPRLEVLDRLGPPPSLPVVNEDHVLCIRIASEILSRLEEKLP